MKTKSRTCSTGHGTGVVPVVELKQLLDRPRMRQRGCRLINASGIRWRKRMEGRAKAWAREQEENVRSVMAVRDRVAAEREAAKPWNRIKRTVREYVNKSRQFLNRRVW